MMVDFAQQLCLPGLNAGIMCCEERLSGQKIVSIESSQQLDCVRENRVSTKF